MRSQIPFSRSAMAMAAASAVLAASSLHAQAATPPGGASASKAAPTQSSLSPASKADRDFFVGAAEDGTAEVELGKLAQQKGSEPVKAFGGQMVTDHTKAGDELKALAATKGVNLPASPGKHQKDIDKLAKKSGGDFDRDYSKHMVDAHQQAVSKFEKAAKSADDPELKAFASKTLPTLKQHLEHAKSLNASVKAAKKAG